MHDWNISPKQAVQLQRSLAGRVSLEYAPQEVRYIAGADVSSTRYSDDIYAGIAVFTYPHMEQVAYSCIRSAALMKYIPGLLSFREIPALLKAWEKLQVRPDIVVVDGQGIAHPRRLGIATHFGLLAEVPTIGCAKSKLYGSVGDSVGLNENVRLLLDPKDKSLMGYEIHTKRRARPVYVSPGHLMDFEHALSITSSCLKGYRLPEPTRRAHEIVNKCRKGDILSA